MHGIQAADLLDAPEFHEISHHLLDMLAGRAIVAHNAVFDMRFLHQEFNRGGYKLARRPDVLCTMQWSGRLLGAAKLQHCCEALSIPLDNAHSALADAEAATLLSMSREPQH